MSWQRSARVMNWTGGTLLFLSGIALLMNKASAQPPWAVLLIAMLYALFTGTAYGSAWSLLHPDKTTLRRVMVFANWGWIAFYSGSMSLIAVAVLVGGYSSHLLVTPAPGVFALVIPQAINLMVFRRTASISPPCA